MARATNKPPAIFYVNAALFDCDGTLVNSTGAISEFWRDFAQNRPHIDADEIIRTSHGCRTFDVIAKWSPDDAIDQQVTEWESSIPDTFGQFASPIPGAVELVKKIEELSRTETHNRHQRWAIITSGTLPLASKWLKLLALEKPECFITAEGVSIGKPHPQGYKKARESLGYDSPHKKIVVFEDAPAGIKAGRDAGAMIVGICSTYNPDTIRKSGADIVVNNLSSFDIEGYNPETDEIKIIVRDYHFANEEYINRHL